MVQLAKKIFILMAILSPSGFVSATGAFLTNEYMQVAPTESKVAIYFDGETETLIAGETFNFNPLTQWNFVWLIPVPSKPEVHFVNSDIFSMLSRLADSDATISTGLKPANLLSYRTFEPEKVSNGEFSAWLSNYGYNVPKRLVPVLDRYVKNGWYMVAVTVNALHITTDARESLSVYGASTLPVAIRFKTDKMLYPLKFQSVSQDVDSVDIPISFEYGPSTKERIGTDDEQVKSLVSSKSLNKFPRLPLDLLNLKIDAYIFSDIREVKSEGYAKISSGFVDGSRFSKKSWDAFYLDLPQKQLRLTHLQRFERVGELEDVVFEEKELSLALAAAGLFGFAGGVKLNFFFATTVVLVLVGIFSIWASRRGKNM